MVKGLGSEIYSSLEEVWKLWPIKDMAAFGNCAGMSMDLGIILKKVLPDANVFLLYSDNCSRGPVGDSEHYTTYFEWKGQHYSVDSAISGYTGDDTKIDDRRKIIYDQSEEGLLKKVVEFYTGSWTKIGKLDSDNMYSGVNNGCGKIRSSKLAPRESSGMNIISMTLR